MTSTETTTIPGTLGEQIKTTEPPIQKPINQTTSTSNKGFSFETFWNTGNNKYWIIGCIVVLIFIIIIVICISCKSKEKYCPCQSDMNKINKAKSKLNQIENTRNRETFVSTGGSAFVDKQGNISGPHVASDMYSKVPFSELRNAVENNKPLPVDEIIGAGRGDNFDSQFQMWRATQEKEMNDPTAVKSMAEIEETSKSVSANLGNDTSCMLTRAGSSRAKIKYEPNGTIAVCSEYSTPERDKNHIIYMGSYLVDVPGYQMDTNRINDEITLGTNELAKNFSPKTNKVISTAGGSSLDQTARGVTNTENPTETFSASQ